MKLDNEVGSAKNIQACLANKSKLKKNVDSWNPDHHKAYSRIVHSNSSNKVLSDYLNAPPQVCKLIIELWP